MRKGMPSARVGVVFLNVGETVLDRIDLLNYPVSGAQEGRKNLGPGGAPLGWPAAVGEGVAAGPGIAQLGSIGPVTGTHALVDHAAVVARGVGEEAGGGILNALLCGGKGVAADSVEGLGFRQRSAGGTAQRGVVHARGTLKAVVEQVDDVGKRVAEDAAHVAQNIDAGTTELFQRNELKPRDATRGLGHNARTQQTEDNADGLSARLDGI